MNNEFNYRWDDPVQIRNCPYLNNVVALTELHLILRLTAVPALTFKWIRILYACRKTNKQYDESRYLQAFKERLFPSLL